MFSKLRRTPLKKTPWKKNKKVVNQEEIDKMKAFFLLLWSKLPHYCAICGTWLGSEPHTYHFDHILEKSKYPELKYEEKNIKLLCLECHDCKSRGIFPSSYAVIIEKTKKLFNVE